MSFLFEDICRGFLLLDSTKNCGLMMSKMSEVVAIAPQFEIFFKTLHSKSICHKPIQTHD